MTLENYARRLPLKGNLISDGRGGWSEQISSSATILCLFLVSSSHGSTSRDIFLSKDIMPFGGLSSNFYLPSTYSWQHFGGDPIGISPRPFFGIM